MADPVLQGGAVLTGEIKSAALIKKKQPHPLGIQHTSSKSHAQNLFKYLESLSVNRSLYPSQASVKRNFRNL